MATEWAASIDALDGALGQAGQVARQMSETHRVAGSVERMLARGQELLSKLTSAVDGVGELYTKLLELSATSGLSVDVTLDRGPADATWQAVITGPSGRFQTGDRPWVH